MLMRRVSFQQSRDLEMLSPRTEQFKIVEQETKVFLLSFIIFLTIITKNTRKTPPRTLLSAFILQSDPFVPNNGVCEPEDGGMDGAANEEGRITDWRTGVCRLCQRQFPTKVALLRHQQLSDLHKVRMVKQQVLNLQVANIQGAAICWMHKASIQSGNNVTDLKTVLNKDVNWMFLLFDWDLLSDNVLFFHLLKQNLEIQRRSRFSEAEQGRRDVEVS